MPDIKVGATRNILDPNSKTFEERGRELAKQDEADKKAAEQAKKSPFSNWYQFNREHSKEFIWLAGNHSKAHQILLFMLDQMDNYNAIVCSYAVFQEALGMGRATVARGIKVLKECNFISVYKSGASNVYVVNKNLAWGSWGKNYKYAKFDAKIIITESEQEENKIQNSNNEIITEKLKQLSVHPVDSTKEVTNESA